MKKQTIHDIILEQEKFIKRELLVQTILKFQQNRVHKPFNYINTISFSL